MDLGEKIQKRVRELMILKQCNIYYLCKISEVPESTLRSIVNGTSKNPKLESIEAVAGAMELSMREVFNCDLFD